MGLITMTCGGLGWLVGPIAGNAIFNFKIGKGKKAQMNEKEVEFYRRIKRYRIDPSASSMANPVPGESPLLLGRGVWELMMYRLLWREDIECSRLSAMAEGSASIQ